MNSHQLQRRSPRPNLLFAAAVAVVCVLAIFTALTPSATFDGGSAALRTLSDDLAPAAASPVPIESVLAPTLNPNDDSHPLLRRDEKLIQPPNSSSFFSRLRHRRAVVPPRCGEGYMPGQDGIFYSDSKPLDSILVAVFPWRAIQPHQIHLDLPSSGDADDDGGSITPIEAVVRAMASPRSGESSPYFNLFDSTGAVLSVLPSNYDDNDGDMCEFFKSLDARVRSSETTVNKSSREAFDVVFTYVRDTAPTFQQNLRRFCSMMPENQRTSEMCSTNRFHDWGEIRYAMQSVFARAGMLLRRIYLVVPDGDDQIPTEDWLNESFVHKTQNGRFTGENSGGPLLNEKIWVVTHSEIFGNNGAMGDDALPTFNSHAIEANLHRIPELSRYFLYFNNDMLLGRNMSLFDLWRPVASSRKLQRLEWIQQRSGMMRRGGDQEEGKKSRSCTPDDFKRSLASLRGRMVFFEPIVYFEDVDRTKLCKLHKVKKNKQKGLEPALQRHLEQHGNAVKQTACLFQPLDAQFFFTLRCAGDAVENGDHGNLQQRQLSHWELLKRHNAKLFFSRINTFLPEYQFAHLPLLFDREVLTHMQEVEFSDAHDMTTRSRLRQHDNLWTTWMYPYFALAHRRGFENWLDASGASSSIVGRERQMRRWEHPTDIDLLDFTSLTPRVTLLSSSSSSSSSPAVMLFKMRTSIEIRRLRSKLKALSCGIGQSSCGSMLAQKLDGEVVLAAQSGHSPVDQSTGTLASEHFVRSTDYAFYMLNSAEQIAHIASRWSDESKPGVLFIPPLFVTLNDNYVRDEVFGEKPFAERFDELMQLIVAGLQQAPFERRDPPPANDSSPSPSPR